VECWRALVAELNQGALGCDAPHLHLPALESAGDGLRDTVRLRLGFRLPARLSGRVVIDRLRQLDPKAHLEIERSEPAVTVPRSGPLPTAFSRAIRAAGRRPDWQQRLATSDRNVVLPVWKCAAVVYGPGDAELDHTPLESIALDDYGRAIEVLTRVLTEL
jgi:LysW-gamma-L-lysine carboxypeptidase